MLCQESGSWDPAASLSRGRQTEAGALRPLSPQRFLALGAPPWLDGDLGASTEIGGDEFSPGPDGAGGGTTIGQ